MKKILLVDIENIQKTEKELLKYLSQYQYVYLVYAKSPVSFSLDGLVQLSPFVMNGKLKVLKMPKVGKDAADFGLAFIAGQLSTQVSAKEYLFEVMSNDHSMEYVIELLKIAKFDAKVIHEKPLVSPHVINEVKAEINVDQLVYQYCEYLNKQSSRPAKLETLLNSLKAILKVNDEVSKVLVEFLKKHKILRLDNNKPVFQDPSLHKYLRTHSYIAETAIRFKNLRSTLMMYLNSNEHIRPKTVMGFTTVLKKWLAQEDVTEEIELLKKYDLITVNSKRQISYSSKLFMMS